MVIEIEFIFYGWASSYSDRNIQLGLVAPYYRLPITYVT